MNHLPSGEPRMDELPAGVLAEVSEDARAVVCRWWADLTDKQRRQLLTAWDEQRETAFFSPLRGDTEAGVPVVIGGKFVPAENPFISPEWHADYFEYLLKNPELLVNEKQVFILGGVCTAHPEARAALEAGGIPAGFTCPRANVDCPMRKWLDRAPGCSLMLTGPVIGSGCKRG